MVILKKIKAATLIETLTASVLIIIVFMIASLSFNTIFSNHVKRDNSTIDNHIKELEYLVYHQKIKLPYTEEFAGWDIEMVHQKNNVIIHYSKQGKEQHKTIYPR